MKNTCTFLSVVLALAVALPAAQARSSGHSSGGHSVSGSHFHSLGTSHVSSIQNVRPTSFTGQIKTGQVNTPKNLGNKVVINKGLDKGLDKGLNKNLVKNDHLKKFNKKWYPGKNWWGWGYGFGWGGWWGYGGYDYCGYCPWYYSPCYNVCSCYYTPCDCTYDAEAIGPEGGPQPTPAAKTVRIVNPAETQTTLGFAVNGQPYSLEAGQTRDLELTANEVIEFDRGSGNDTARYSLSDGVYQFAATPQGWELYHSSVAPRAEAVAAN